MPVGAQPTDSPAPGGVGIRLLEAPVALRNDPRAQAYIIDNLAPGTQITRRIEVSNGTEREQMISLYPAAATISDSGGFEVGEDRAVNELTTWMQVSPGEVTVAAHSAAEATVTIDVPADAPEGEQYAVVWAQMAGQRTSAGIQNVSRAGIRTYLSVGPGNGPAADFRITGMSAHRSDTGAPQVLAEVANTGGRAIDPTGTLTLSGGPGGVSTTPVTSSGGSVAPGKTGTITFTLDPALAAGPWNAAADINSGLISHSSHGSLTFPAEGSTEATASTSDTGTPSWVWATPVAAVAVVAGAGVLFLARRRRKTH